VTVATLVDGEPASDALAAALGRVTALVPYLTAAVDPDRLLGAGPPVAAGGVPADREWVPSARVIDDPAWLARIISSTGHQLGTDDPVVAASAFVQGYSYRVLTLCVACLTAAGVVPDASASSMAFALAGPWPSQIAFLRPTVMILDGGPDAVATLPPDSDTITDALRFVVDHAIDRHLRPLIECVHAGIGVAVGHRLLWGNVAASAATAFRTMAGCLGPRVEPLGARFFDLAPAELHGLGHFTVLENGRARGWFWERTSCCLFDRLPDGIRCADCSLTPARRRRQAYRDSLDAS
jgi:Ferric iron reductase FhuF-like transporter